MEDKVEDGEQKKKKRECNGQTAKGIGGGKRSLEMNRQWNIIKPPQTIHMRDNGGLENGYEEERMDSIYLYLDKESLGNIEI